MSSEAITGDGGNEKNHDDRICKAQIERVKDALEVTEKETVMMGRK